MEKGARLNRLPYLGVGAHRLWHGRMRLRTDSVSLQDFSHSSQKNARVQKHASVVYVPHVQSEPLLPANSVTAVDLHPTGNPRLAPCSGVSWLRYSINRSLSQMARARIANTGARNTSPATAMTMSKNRLRKLCMRRVPKRTLPSRNGKIEFWQIPDRPTRAVRGKASPSSSGMRHPVCPPIACGAKDYRCARTIPKGPRWQPAYNGLACTDHNRYRSRALTPPPSISWAP